MHDQLRPMTAFDAGWFLIHPRRAFRIRPASEDECRAAGVQDPDAVAVVSQACGGGFVLIASGKASPSAGAVKRLAEALDLPNDVAAQLAEHLPAVRPDTLAHAAARLIRNAPWCSGCRCAVRWSAVFGGIAMETAPKNSAGLAELEAAFADFKARTPDRPAARISDQPVVTASAAIREIGRIA